MKLTNLYLAKLSEKAICCVASKEALWAKERVACMSGVFSSTVPLPLAAGFRRSMRLCRRKARLNQQSCYSRCPSSCYSTLAAPYEEVVRYQRHPTDRHRLIILVGKRLTTFAGRVHLSCQTRGNRNSHALSDPLGFPAAGCSGC